MLYLTEDQLIYLVNKIKSFELKCYKMLYLEMKASTVVRDTQDQVINWQQGDIGEVFCVIEDTVKYEESIR